MKQTLVDFHSDPNIGLHGIATEKFIVLGSHIMEKDVKQVQEALNVPVYQTSLFGIDVIGIFLAGNSHGIIAPSTLHKDEKKKLESIGLPVTFIETKHTCLGNLILCNDKGALISPLLEKEQKQIEKALKVKTEIGTLGTLAIVGSTGITTNSGCMVHPLTTDEEAKRVEDILGVKVDVGSVNFGSPFVRSGILANSNGICVGSQSSGPEITRIQETLGD